jgi:hypothetical protein
VSAVRYCYWSDQLGNEKLVFTLLILERSGQNFTTRNVINVRSTPTAGICTRGRANFLLVHVTLQYCCDTLHLNTTDQFYLPTPNFAFGITAQSGVGVLGGLLSFNASHSQYAVEHYRPVGNTVKFETDRRLRLFKFELSKLAGSAFMYQHNVVLPTKLM